MRAWPLIFLLFCAVTVQAQTPESVPDPVYYSIQLENDFLALSGDRFYTNGLEISRMRLAETPPPWMVHLAEYNPLYVQGSYSAIVYQLGQKIFTPEATWSDALESDDRPYAGWTYANLALFSLLHDGEMVRSGNGVYLTLGIVGPWARGEETQNAFHQLVGDEPAQGWRYQLHNEPGLVMGYVHRWQIIDSLGDTGLEYEVGPHLTLALGNVYTFGGGGMMLRVGKSLRNDFGPNSTISPGFPGLAYFQPGQPFNWYLFFGYESRVVGRNIFLDGNTFDASSHRVHREMIVGDFQRGVLFQWSSFRLSLTQMLRSKEFDGQSDPVMYGALNLTWTR